MHGQEKALQRLCAQWLTLHGIYFECDRMDRRTSGKCGRADFRVCHRGRWLSCECKDAGQPLTQAQEREADRAAAFWRVVRSGLGLRAPRLSLPSKLKWLKTSRGKTRLSTEQSICRREKTSGERGARNDGEN